MRLKCLLLAIVLFCFYDKSTGQQITGVLKEKPFSISGNVGLSANYYHSTESPYSVPDFSWNFNGGLTPRIYGIQLPVNLIVNKNGASANATFTQFGLSPEYKWLKVHAGYRNMNFSPFTYENQSFHGMGLELNPKKFHFAGFYGSISRKKDEDTVNNKNITPVYKREAYGAKVGYGDKNRFDLIYFHARDDSSSSNVINKSKYRPQENTVLGASFQFEIFEKLSFTGDVAMSGITEDQAAIKNPADAARNGAQQLVEKTVAGNASTSTDFAFQSKLGLRLEKYSTSINFRRVQPNFKSLGTAYLMNNIQWISWENNFNILDDKFSVSASLSNQHDNLNDDLAFQTINSAANFVVSGQIGTKTNLSVNYSGTLTNQKDGTEKLTDSTRLNQMSHSFSILPVFSFAKDNLTHNVSISMNYMIVDDKNPASKEATNVSNISLSAGYGMRIAKKRLGLNANLIFNQYKQTVMATNSYGINLGGSKQLLKKNNLSIQLNLGYRYNYLSGGAGTSSINANSGLTYSYKKHLFGVNMYYVSSQSSTAISGITAPRSFRSAVTYSFSF